MKDSLPPPDLESLERHRAEARWYLPPTEEEYQKAIDEGKDPYFARWWIGSMLVLAFGTVAVQAAIHYGWGGV